MLLISNPTDYDAKVTIMLDHKDESGEVWYNWNYVDSVLEFILSIGIRPIVELGFMPNDLATGSETIFLWEGNITQPKDYQKWANLVDNFVRYCIM